MKLSIITATYNSSETIRDTFDSVLAQTYTNYEYIVIDGASKDSTVDIIKEYEPKFQGRMQWISESDKGIYDAMNKGFQCAEGEVLMLINSDDLFARPDALSIIVETFKKHPNTDCVYADIYYVAKDNTSKIVRTWNTGVQRPFAKGWLPAHPTFYVKRELYKKYGYFDLNFVLAADFELMLRFVEKHHISLVYLPEHITKMRLGGATSKNIKNIYRQNKECYRAFKKNGIPVTPLYIFYRLFPKIKQFL